VKSIRIAVVGLGKIARDQHIPALQRRPDFALAATVDPASAALPEISAFETLDALLDSEAEIDAVTICTPPQVRHRLAAAALRRGKHVFLEKPPAASLSEAALLLDIARDAGVTVFAGWHSRFAAGVDAARSWLGGRRVLSAKITWREDVRKWHPGQSWIWRPGGLGVFDPGINALSIATHILPQPLILTDAELEVPSNREAPIAARLSLEDRAGAQIAVELDWRQTGPQTWDIEVETDAGPLVLSRGGAELTLPSGSLSGEDAEYTALYVRFSELIRNGLCELDSDPFRLVADAFLRGRTVPTDPFHD